MSVQENNLEALSNNFEQTLVAGNVKGAMREAGAKSRDLWQVGIGLLRVLEGFNVRVKNQAYAEHIASLAASMKTEGFYQDKPLGGYVAREGDDNVIYITDGHCRLEAILLANSQGAEILTVPVVVTAGGTNIEDLTVALARSNSGKPLSPFEMAVVAKRLMRFNWGEKEIAARMGVSITTVKNYLALMEAPREVRQMVADEEVGLHTALDSLRTLGAGAVEQLQAAVTRAGSSTGGSGKKVERRDVVGKTFASCVKKAAPRMFDTFTDIRADQGYAALSTETRIKIDSLMTELEKLRETEKSSATTTESAANAASGGGKAQVDQSAKSEELAEAV